MYRIRKRRCFFGEFARNRYLYLMTLPGILYIVVMYYIPMPGALIAFKNYNPIKGFFKSEWVGFKNFEFFFQSSSVMTVTLNTLLYNALFLVLGLGLAVLLSILLNEIRDKKLLTIYKGVLFLPFLISWVVASYLLFGLLSTDRGLVNQLLSLFGKEAVMWYAEPGAWRTILTLSYLWHSAGYFMVIFLAAIVGINPEIYEAAEIDGANKFAQALRITIPHLVPAITTLVLLQAGKLFFANFGDWGMFFTLPNESGVLYDTTDVIDTYVFRSIRQMGDFGMSAAIGFYQSVVGCILVLFFNYLVKKFNSENSLF